MRLQRIEVTNFLCFRNLRLPVDPHLQIVAGPNNAGKSSLARLLEAFFADPDGAALVNLAPLDDYYAAAGPRILSTIKLWFGDLNDEEKQACEPGLRRDGLIWVSLRCSRAGKVSYDASRNVGLEQARRLYEYVLSQHHFVKVPSVRVGGEGDVERPESIERLVETVEAILIRRGGTRSTNLQREFSDRAEPVEELVARVLDESAIAIRGDLPFQDDRVEFRLGDFRHALRGILEAASIESVGGIAVPVEKRGTGFQSAMVLGILRYVASEEAASAGNLIFTVEEPEAFLHPQTQRAMTRIIKGIAQDAQVLITTHSPVVIDSLPLQQIVRLPLGVGGTEFEWVAPDLSDTDEGRLSRYCNAANSELVFAAAAIFVEGEGDRHLVEHLLGRVCQEPGGHFARGITVIEAAGLGKIKYLVQLANRFGVRSFVLADKDGLKPADGQRRLLTILEERSNPPPGTVAQRIRTLADTPCPSLAAARQQQRRLNQQLAAFDAFVLSSDLEGTLIDALGLDLSRRILGPEGEAVLDEQFLSEIDGAVDEREQLGRKLGSKGWEQETKPTGKLEPHLPRILLQEYFNTTSSVPEELRPLEGWLTSIVEASSGPVI